MKDRATRKLLLRRALDTKLAQATAVSTLLRPPAHGWLRAVREALGMTLAQVARRISVVPKTVLETERRESRGAVTLESLKRTADALECDLVYFLLPRQSLEQLVRRQAHRAARRLMAPVSLTMALEDQSVGPTEDDAQARDLAEAMARQTDSRIWDET